MAEDKFLRELYQRQAAIEFQVRKRKKEIAKERGEVVDSIDDLVCEKHPDAKFKISSEATEGFWSKIYVCKTCEDTEKIPSRFSKAYDCPNCGIVSGEFESRHYRSSQESWTALAGREGEHYYCSVCGTLIGCHYWGFS